MTSRTPQEKKRLSYKNDCRNTYGENSKSSRKNILRSKAQAHRINRHRQNQALAKGVLGESEEVLAQVQLKVMSAKRNRWRKYSDKPLGAILAPNTLRKKRFQRY